MLCLPDTRNFYSVCTFCFFTTPSEGLILYFLYVTYYHNIVTIERLTQVTLNYYILLQEREFFNSSGRGPILRYTLKINNSGLVTVNVSEVDSPKHPL